MAEYVGFNEVWLQPAAVEAVIAAMEGYAQVLLRSGRVIDVALQEGQTSRDLVEALSMWAVDR